MSRLFRVCALLLCGFATVILPNVLFDAAGAAAQEAPRAADAPSLPSKLLQPNIDIEELEYRVVPLTKAELKGLAGEWLLIVKAKTEEVMEAQVTVAQTDGAVEDAVREKLTATHGERSKLFDKYSAVLDAWEKKGGDPAAIAEYRGYQSAIALEETQKADYKTLTARALAWLTDEDGGIELVKDVAIVVISFLGLLFVARMVRKFVRRWIGHVPNLSSLLQAFIIGIVYWLVLAFGLMIVLSALGVDITPLFALIGGASIIAAFAMQDTLSNLASGLLIMIYRPFDEGDYVDTGGVNGTVKSVNIVATTVVTPDNKVIVIPNKNVWGNIITNVTASDTRRVDLIFGISYDDSIPQALHILEEAVTAHPLVLKDPEPTIRVNELADSSVNLICRPWVKTEDYWTVYWDLMRYVKELFDAAGISIPYPQQDVHYIDSKAAPKPTAGSVLAKEKKSTTATTSIAEGDEGTS
jgi:small conductance mechanosensitive channel